ncbi:hypothetical protein ACE1AT_11095 [Pelatocladus sp. BLCC-F211]|uniref:hypothetical protein n=1 Tax=Pelatocladus sp. BLCC-F211 TaxID=3342752 RepID=UPI0035B71B09
MAQGRKRKQTVVIPSTWETPKYCFGQRVKQGIIIGMEYFVDVEHGWKYVCSDPNSEDYEVCDEPDIETYEPQELHALIKDEIVFHKSKIVALTEQLESSGEKRGR